MGSGGRASDGGGVDLSYVDRRLERSQLGKALLESCWLFNVSGDIFSKDGFQMGGLGKKTHTFIASSCSFFGMTSSI